MSVAAHNAAGAQADAEYDVAVLGSHLATGMLAAILARHGVRVVLLDSAEDRRTLSGESTVPYTTAVLQLLAERFDVPEIGAFAHFVDLPATVQAASGIKKSLAFLYHQPGRPHDPAQTVQFNVPGEHNEWHPYRPVVDEHARNVAVGRGAHVLPGRAPVTQVRIDADTSRITLADGRCVTARYVVDACGADSPLLTELGRFGRSHPIRLRSRILRTHMKRVRPLEQCAHLRDYPQATAWSLGTVHHLFAGGWVQVIDFANHGGAENGLCSVTVGLDPDEHADLPAEPEAAFRALVARFPTVAAQFDNAVAVRPWTTGIPWRRPASAAHGPRHVSVERSIVHTDEFLSRDVTVSAEIVHALAASLLRIVRGGADPETEFRRIAGFQDLLVDFNDRMLAAARTACRDFRLWNAYSRVWLLWQILAHLSLKRATADSAAGPAQPAGTWPAVERFDAPLWFRTPAGLVELLDWFFDQFEKVDSGILTPAEAATAVFRALRRARFVPPLYRFGAPDARYYQFTMGRRLLMLAWVKTVAPRDFKRLLTRDNVTGRRSAPTAPVPVGAASPSP